MEFAELMRPLFGRAISEHEALMARSGCDPLPAQGRLAQALPHRRRISRHGARARCGGDVRPGAAGARAGCRACAGAVVVAGVSSRGALAGDRERQQSAGRDPRLCGAVPAHSAASRSTAMPARCAATANTGGSRPRRGRSISPNLVVALGPWAPDVLTTARHPAAAGGQARLSPPLPAAGQCGSHPPGGRYRDRLLPGADGAGHPLDDRRGIRRRAMPTDARAVRPVDAVGARVCSRSESRSRPRPGWAVGRALPIRVR